MNRLLILVISAFTSTFALAESAWQYLPDYGGAEGFLERDGGLYVVFGSGLISATEDGVTWRQITDLGEGLGNVNITNVLSTEAGFSVWTRDIAPDGSLDGYRLYRSTDGESWELALESLPDGPDGQAPSLSEMWPIDTGWLLYTERRNPAIVWFSSDGFTWEEVYRNDERAFQTGKYATGSGHALKFTEPYNDRFIASEDGLAWKEVGPVPQRIIDAGSYLLGSANNPLLNGRVFYSENGLNWETVYQPVGRTQPQLLLRGGGVTLLITNHRNVAYSANGRDWQMADFPTDLLEGMNFPFVPTIVYSSGAFHYRLVPHPPPNYEGPDLGVFTFRSSDGASWSVSPFPDTFTDVAEWGEPNPDYVNPPHPNFNPEGPDGRVEKEIQIDGYSLKMARLPEGRKMGLYLGDASGVYDIVNTSFGNVYANYPFVPPLDITAIGQVFFVLTEAGRIGLFDPAANYLPQPMRVSASYGDLDDRIRFSWDPVEEATAYRVYRSLMGSHAPVEIGTTGETEFFDNIDLTIEDSYDYQVQAIAEGRHSMLSGTATGRLWSIVVCNYDSGWGEGRPSGGIFPGTKLISFTNSNLQHYPWIYTRDHHWQYCVEKPGMLWLYDLQLGWLWTRNFLYPNVYQTDGERWLYWIAADAGIRWFYDHAGATFMPVPR